MARSARILGWSTALFSIILLLSEFSNLLTNPTEQLTMVFTMFPQAKSGMEAVTDSLQYSRIWSVYMILYFSFVFFGSIKFIQFRAIGRTILEIACWIGILNACIDTLMSYILWKQLQTALSAMTGPLGMNAGILNPLALGTILLSFFLWIILSGGMIVYFRKPALKALMN